MGDGVAGGALPEGMLRCGSCGRVSEPGEHAWRAVHGIDEHDGVVLVAYCPVCWAAQLEGPLDPLEP